jgi:hypothetical protein
MRAEACALTRATQDGPDARVTTVCMIMVNDPVNTLRCAIGHIGPRKRL